MVAYVASRTAVADFSASGDEARKARYHTYFRPLFRTGAAAAVVACCVAPLLGLLLGAGWAAVVPTVVVLSCSLPWRMIAGQGGSLAIAAGKARDLVRWEMSRLVGFALAYVLAACIGYGAFVVTVSVVWIGGITSLQLAAERGAGVTGPMKLWRWAGVACVIAMVAGALLAIGGWL